MTDIMNAIKELRNRTGLSAQKFGDKYSIPMRTIQNWESGTTTCPEYVLGLLTRAVNEDFPKEITKQYYLFEKNEDNSFKKYTFDELKSYFEPNPEIASDGEKAAYANATDLEGLKDFIENFVNNSDGVHYNDYYIEEC